CVCLRAAGDRIGRASSAKPPSMREMVEEVSHHAGPDGRPGRMGRASDAQRKTPQPWLRGFGVKTLAMTYSRMLNAHYHRRVRVSLPSSEWDRVVPRSYCHQGEGGGSRAVAGLTRTRSRWFASERNHGAVPPSANKSGT